jgi:hypothetical protein
MGPLRAWLAATLTIHIMLAGLASGQMCVHLVQGNSWSTGMKIFVTIPPNQTYPSWNLELSFSPGVSTVEAWKGSVEELQPLDGTRWRVVNKCYNGLLYPCQCLEVGMILRYPAYTDPTFDVDFNQLGILPICADQPDCEGSFYPEVTTTTSAPTCPYTCSDPGGPVSACDLWDQLQDLVTSTPPPQASSTPYSSCPYLNETQGVSLCYLWCQIQLYSGSECVGQGAAQCPHALMPSSYTSLLCSLWAQTEDLTPTSGVAASGNTVFCPYSEEPLEFSGPFVPLLVRDPETVSRQPLSAGHPLPLPGGPGGAGAV